MRSSIRSRTSGHAGDLHAKVMGHSQYDSSATEFALRVRVPISRTHRTDAGDIESRRTVLGVDDSAAFRIRNEFSDLQVLAIAEQDHGYGWDSGGGSGSPHGAELAADVEARMGIGWCCGGAQRVLVVYCDCSAFVHIQWNLWQSLVWIFNEGFSESMGFR